MKRTYLKEHAFGQTASYFITVKYAYKPFNENLSFLHTQISLQIKISICTLQKASCAIQSPYVMQ